MIWKCKKNDDEDILDVDMFFQSVKKVQDFRNFDSHKVFFYKVSLFLYDKNALMYNININ